MDRNTAFEWKKDPQNDCWVGPDGCHYDEKWEARSIGVLGMCGCGNPEESYNFLRDALKMFDRRENHTDRGTPWLNAEGKITKMVKAQPELAAHIISHFLSDKDVLEHGGSVGGSWLTKSGEDIVDGDPAPTEQ